MTKIYYLNCILFLTIFFHPYSSSAQDSLEFKPTGTIIAKGFLDYSTGLGNAQHTSGFDITRAFLGYNYKFTRTLQAQLVVDGASGKVSSGSLEVYVRNAFVNWKDKNFNINGGLIGLLEYNTQELYWMHRYVLKSYQDLNKMAPSVDLGVSVEYTFNPFITADLTFTNGEGYKKVKKDNSARYAGGISLHPTRNTIFRVYGDVYNHSEELRDALPAGVTNANYKNQYILALFAGYMDKTVSCGVEYNHLYNKGFIENKNYYGYSVYSSVKVAPKFRVYGRYDLTKSTQPNNFNEPWNDLDGQLMIVGVEFRPAKQLKISPNIRNLNPTRSRSEQYFYINLDFNL